MSGGVETMGITSSKYASDASIPREVFRSISVRPVPFSVAKPIIERGHYLHTMPGGCKLTFGVFKESNLLGVLTFGVGPMNAFKLVEGATPEDCMTLTRLWLADELPKNAESFVLGLVIRALKTHTSLRFLVTYADPSAGHVGTIYQASNWVYTGLSDASPLYDIGDGKLRHSRSLSNHYGTHSITHFQGHDVEVTVISQSPKHRYCFFLDPEWRSKLRVPVLAYPKKEIDYGTS